jgi:FtsP/CotA-like multicopper oxidase with cupredoxin domain
MAPQVGLEPTTLRLTAGCSAIELLRSVGDLELSSPIIASAKGTGTVLWCWNASIYFYYSLKPVPRSPCKGIWCSRPVLFAKCWVFHVDGTIASGMNVRTATIAVAGRFRVLP